MHVDDPADAADGRDCTTLLTQETRVGFAEAVCLDDVEVVLYGASEPVTVSREHLRLEDDDHTVVIDTTALDAKDGAYRVTIELDDDGDDRGLLARLWGLVRP